MNKFILQGFVNKKVSFDNGNCAFSLAYSVKRDEQYKSVWISSRTVKGLDVVEKDRYQIEGFLSGDIFTNREGKEKNKPVLIVQKATPIEKGVEPKNEFTLVGKAVNVKVLEKGNTVGAIMYKVKLQDEKEGNIFYDFIAKKELEIPTDKEIEVKGFFTGDIWTDNEGKDRNKTKLFIMEVKEAETKSE